ncbi:integrin alpha-PS1-like isoform X2 [Cylas formicarius]|uniref:integrin alpha-PS1-like isoform X2 n=1 Tax=Cylas formicarius TaxID=197179 RepID=UPI002958BB76|nr:integrin alpha-PS1-like isoform X2 [Cylas formicarius]
MFHKLLLVSCLLVPARRTVVDCFNIEDRDPLVKKAPDDQIGSYFGFSVALHKAREDSSSIADNWLLVGAPLGKNLQPGSNFSGALFKCPISNSDTDCVQVETDGQRLEDFDYGDNDNENDGLKPPGADEIKTGQWLGVSVRSQKPGGLVIVCAHRYIQSPDLSKFHFGQGFCYLLDSDLKATESLQYCKGRPTEKLHQQYGFCQIGTSSAFVGDDFALVGAPGPYTWRGTIFGQVVVGDFLDRDKTIYRGPLNDNPTPIDKYSYLGMSVAGGHFFSKKRYTYASGAPRSQMVGQVYFFDKNQGYSNSEEFNISLIVTGQQFASSFGYEILAVDVNNDGYDELLVGAPFYYGEGEGGAVYIYYNLRGCNSDADCKWDKVMYGKEQSRFGFAMTSIGDINKDGYNDIAIGAPYENQHGAVYIYLGSASGLNEEPSQVMRFEQLTTFGYSLSGGLDMDNNGYPDLLVGAYDSDRALLFKTRPIIDIKIDISGNEMKNINASRKGCSRDPGNLNNTCFSITSCFKISGQAKKFERFSVEYYITEIKKIVSRVWFQNEKYPNKRAPDNRRVVEVSSFSKAYCQNELVYIKEGVSDILSPIKFKVKYTLENDNKYHTPILNKTSVKDFEATFQKNCGEDDVCVSYLVLKAGTNLEKNADGEYTVNMVNEEFVLDANITNYNESAYEAKLFVFHPPALSYINLKTEKDQPTSAKCSFKNETLVVCDLGNPFHGNSTANLKLRFEIMKDTKDQKLDLRLLVNSTSTESSPYTSQNVVAILQKIADFMITGKGSTNLFYGGQVIGESAMKHLEDIGARVTHHYGIDNRGEWDLPDIRLHIRWPYQVRAANEGDEGKWLLYLEGIPTVSGFGVTGLCEVEDESVINPLNLTLLNPPTDEPENLLLPQEIFYDNETSSTLRRRRRDVEYVVQPQEITKGGIKRRITALNCIARTAKCANIVCYIRKLKKQHQAYIEIRSRIWNSTLVEDYNNVDWVQINSHAVVELTDATFITKPEQIFDFSAETLMYPETVQPYSELNIWIIVGAVIAGLLLLIVLVVILYKCGFFKRKRVSKDPTLSGNLLMKEENDKLLMKSK